MMLSKLVLANFRCFGPKPIELTFEPDLTCFIGANGSGKTAALQALMRLFGVTADQRQLRLQDFHNAATKQTTKIRERTLAIEAWFNFPELQSDAEPETAAVPDFFHAMSFDHAGAIHCRIRLDATWTDDGSLDGNIESKYRVVRTADSDFDNVRDCQQLRPVDRGRIQLVYVPAMRDGASQIVSFLRGRIWRSIAWSDSLRTDLSTFGTKLNETLSAETAVATVRTALQNRWHEVHQNPLFANPEFRPVAVELEDFVSHVDVRFQPDEHKRERAVSELSDGQRSLFHIAMTSALLDVEAKALAGQADGFGEVELDTPDLTIIGIEEPENSLSPFYLSRIMAQLSAIGSRQSAQAMVASHSPSVLARVAPDAVRYFRLDEAVGHAEIRKITLPDNADDAGKYIREAIRTFPELYFARYVVLGEGSSEEVVLPRIADAMSLPIDRSFVALVPLGGRHMNHMWRLLNDLSIPHATLLDFDAGRSGGGIGRIRTAVQELVKYRGSPIPEFCAQCRQSDLYSETEGRDEARTARWIKHLRNYSVYYCWPLDLDLSMMRAYPEEYKAIFPGGRGPSTFGDSIAAVLGDGGNPDAVDLGDDAAWYRYLFLGKRGKPNTHLEALSRVDDAALRPRVPEELHALLTEMDNYLSSAQSGLEPDAAS